MLNRKSGLNMKLNLSISPCCCPTWWFSRWALKGQTGRLTKPTLYIQQKYSTLLWRVLCVCVCDLCAICACVCVVTWNHRENVPRILGGFGVVAHGVALGMKSLHGRAMEWKGKAPPKPISIHPFAYLCCQTGPHSLLAGWCIYVRRYRSVHVKAFLRSSLYFKNNLKMLNLNLLPPPQNCTSAHVHLVSLMKYSVWSCKL